MQAYVDSSVIVAVAFDERGSDELRERLLSFEALVSANLLEAEVGAAFRRERRAVDRALLTPVTWVTPQRALTEQLDRVFATGYLRGGEAWHVACALYATESPTDLAFLTLDSRQRDVAAQLGFPTP